MKDYLNKFLLLLALAGAANFVAFAQAKAKIVCPEEAAQFAAFVEAAATDNPPMEKAVATDARPTVSFCVTEGSVNVRGWQRNEVRAMVEDGKVGFKIMKRNAENAAAWLRVIGFDPKETVKPGMGKRDECLSGSNIEIEVPYGTFVDVQSRRDADFKIESVAKTKVQNLNGEVLIRDIREEAEISSLAGNIVVEDSVGKIQLKSFSGNVYGIRLKPLNYSDSLNVKSESGNVTLQDIAHANIVAGSSNSNLNYFGELVSGGVYKFSTVSGAVTMFLPLKSSFQFNATLSAGGRFQSLFPIKTTKETKPGQASRFVGTYGTGDATVNITTYSGALRLKKQ
jgi:hypothetical protein